MLQKKIIIKTGLESMDNQGFNRRVYILEFHTLEEILFLGVVGVGVRTGSPNPDPISDINYDINRPSPLIQLSPCGHLAVMDSS